MQNSLYIHIPYCISKCSYCDFFSVRTPSNAAVPDEYIDALCSEIIYRTKESFVDGWKSIYIGGGTPSLLKEEQLLRIIRTAQSCKEKAGISDSGSTCDNSTKTEITMEVNPDDVSPALLNSMDFAGVNRLSCGIQALDDRALKAVCRRSSADVVRRALSLISSEWKHNFSVDMISALPEQTEDTFLHGLEEILTYKPSHISMYSLTVEEQTPLGKEIYSGKIHYDFDFADDLWIKGRDFLLERGYKQYEVSNFCLADNICIHNMVYWQLENYIGCGAGATGSVYETFSGKRFTNTADIDEYIKFWTSENTIYAAEQIPQDIENIDCDTLMFEFFMMGLRTAAGVCRETFESRFKISFPRKAESAFAAWTEKNLAVVYERAGKHYYALNKNGMIFLNKFLTEII